MEFSCTQIECQEKFKRYYCKETAIEEWHSIFLEFKHCPDCHCFAYAKTSSPCFQCNIWYCTLCSQEYQKDAESETYNVCFKCSEKLTISDHKVPCANAIECDICKEDFVQCEICKKKFDCTVNSTLFQKDCQAEPYLVCSGCMLTYKTTDHQISSCRNHYNDPNCAICKSFDINKIWKHYGE